MVMGIHTQSTVMVFQRQAGSATECFLLIFDGFSLVAELRNRETEMLNH